MALVIGMSHGLGYKLTRVLYADNYWTLRITCSGDSQLLSSVEVLQNTTYISAMIVGHQYQQQRYSVICWILKYPNKLYAWSRI